MPLILKMKKEVISKAKSSLNVSIQKKHSDLIHQIINDWEIQGLQLSTMVCENIVSMYFFNQIASLLPLVTNVKISQNLISLYSNQINTSETNAIINTALSQSLQFDCNNFISNLQKLTNDFVEGNMIIKNGFVVNDEPKITNLSVSKNQDNIPNHNYDDIPNHNYDDIPNHNYDDIPNHNYDDISNHNYDDAKKSNAVLESNSNFENNDSQNKNMGIVFKF